MDSERKSSNSPVHYNDIPLLEENSSTNRAKPWSIKRPSRPLVYSSTSSNEDSPIISAKSVFHCDSLRLSKVQQTSDGSFTLDDRLLSCFYSEGQSNQREKLKEFISNLSTKYHMSNSRLSGSILVHSLPRTMLQFCNVSGLEQFLSQSADSNIIEEFEKEIKAFLL